RRRRSNRVWRAANVSPSPAAFYGMMHSERGTVSIARALSKMGFCSRAQGERLVQAGKVRVNGTIVRDVSLRVCPESDARLHHAQQAARARDDARRSAGPRDDL